jgi:uridylate kinase
VSESTPDRTVLLKLSGEALASPDPERTIDLDVVDRFAEQIVRAHRGGHLRLALVIGGGNIWRGASGVASRMDRVTADHMGMAATLINSLALKDALKRHGAEPRVMSAQHVDDAAERYIVNRARRHLEKGRIIICTAGLGVPFFTTDTAAVQRARELEADLLLKGTHGTVDGVYTADPKLDTTATFCAELDFQTVLEQGLTVMDGTAFTHAREDSLPIRIFNAMAEGNIYHALRGSPIGSLIHDAAAPAALSRL